MPTAGYASGQVAEEPFQGKAPSSEVPSVFSRSSVEKGTENMIFIKHLFKIMRRVPKWCLAAAKESKNMVLEQTWCQKDAKWTKMDLKAIQNHLN